MKNITKLLAFSILLFASCEVEKQGVGTDEILNAVYSTSAGIINECVVQNVDRCPFGDRQPASNFWWSLDGGNDYFTPTTYFSSTADHKLVFTEYDNGTASIIGSTVQGTCVVSVEVWLKNRKSWAEWWAQGGGHKKEGCAGNASNSEDLNYYVIDSEKSRMTSVGGDCVAEGTYGIEQRPDPNDPNTPNFGAHVGPGGANYDSKIGALGLSTWGWITDLSTGARLWVMDFNFTFECAVKEPVCETAFARGKDGATCFIGNGFNRWGWSIGPLVEGNYTYDIYAGAGQCDISKGALVGTVDVSYLNGNVNVTYNIDAAYDVKETHTYAGYGMFPTDKKGKATVAPGQYTVSQNLNGKIYVIAHAVVCN